MITISNGLSIIRFPLALLFLSHNLYIRIIAIVFAMISDGVDGYFARKYKTASKFGTFLDPIMDKFFVYFILVIFLVEHRIKLWQGFALISRDFASIFFAVYLVFTKKWSTYEIKPTKWGKITTCLQFFVLIGLTLSFNFSWYVYGIFVLLGVFSFIELISGFFTKIIS